MDTAAPSNRRARQARQIVIDLAVLVAIGVVLGVLAPLGTGYMTVAGRMAYWVLLALAGYLFYKPIGLAVLRLGEILDLPEWALWLGSVLIASVPMAVLVWIVNAGGGPVRTPSLETAITHYFFVAVIGALITLMFNLLPATSAERVEVAPDGEEPSATVAASAATAPDAIHPPFLDRLPPTLGTDLVALEMEDHYVRAHTALGSDLVLMRLRDAIAELGGMEGLQIHRSWWVARHAVADIRRDGRNLRLILDNGLEAPVSRANVTLLKERGWI